MGESRQEYEYWLPGQNGERNKHCTSINSVVIIGANGSGKSKLGAWIEFNNFERVHRVSAQRNLNFSESVPLRSYREATDLLFYGDTEDSEFKDKKSRRWNWGNGYTTTLLDDFDNVLAALIGMANEENQLFVDTCREREKSGLQYPHVPTNAINRLQNVWNSVFPHRAIRLDGASFLACASDGEYQYSATQMSDGERSVLYLAAQVLCLPENKIIIMDEPEVHLHPALMGRLWQALEKERPDCLFIYVTHDLNFAMSHKSSNIIWVKSFDGEKWEYESLPESDLPSELLVDLLGNRLPVLFIEGTKDSLDYRLYSSLFPSCYVVPSGGCEQVVANVRAFSRTDALHPCRAWGIVDRDFKPDEELTSYASNNVYPLAVAEVENLLLTEEVVRVLARRFASNEDEVFQKVKRNIIRRFNNQLDSQINGYEIAYLKRQLAGIDISDGRLNAETIVSAVNPEEARRLSEAHFEEVAKEGDYNSVLRVFNDKSLVKSVGHLLGIDNKDYVSKVVTLLQGDLNDDLRRALSNYVPIMPFGQTDM